MGAWRLVMALWVGVVAVGCSTSGEKDFAEVQRVTGERGYSVRWNQGSGADREVEREVRGLLAQPLTVDQAVQIALLNNRNLQATFEEIGVSQADLVEAGLLRNPVFDAAIRWPTGGAGGANVELSVAQSFIDLVFMPARRRIAAEHLEAAKARVGDEVLNLAARVKRAYFDVQAAEQMVELRRTSLVALKAAADLAGRLRQAGNISQLDADRHAALQEEAEIELTDAEADLKEKREALGVLMGFGSHPDWKIDQRLADVPAREIAPERLEQLAVDQRLDLAAARHEVEAAAKTAGLKRSTRLLPEAQLGVSAERDPEGTSGWVVGPALSVPIPLWDFGQGSVPRAQAQFRQAQRRLEAREVDVRSEVRQAEAKLMSARARAGRYQQVLLPLRHRIVEQAQRHYNGMLLSVFELLDAKRQEIEAGGAYIEALRDYWSARAALERAVGGRLTELPTTRASAATSRSTTQGSSASAPGSMPAPAPAQEHQHHH